jgi:hypothetical protein
MSISTSAFLQDIQALIGPLAQDARQSTRAWDLYEVLILGAVVASARGLGAPVELLDPNGNTVTRYLFRSSPGPLANPSQLFTHAEIRFPGHPVLEAHTGIWVLGKSQLPHECDCVVLLKAEADAARSGGGRTPLWGHVLIHVEGKYYRKPIPFGHGRGFLGLGLDLGWKGSTLVVNRHSANAIQLVRSRRKAAALQFMPGQSGELRRLKERFTRQFIQYQKTGKV